MNQTASTADSTRTHQHSIELDAVPEDVFALLITPSAIRAWWGAGRAIVIPQPGGMWAATWGENEDEPDYVTAATICTFEPPRRLVLENYRYVARSGPLPFDADFRTEFTIEPCETGERPGSRLSVAQHGFPAGPEGDAFLDGCERGWRETFKNIRRYLAERART